MRCRIRFTATRNSPSRSSAALAKVSDLLAQHGFAVTHGIVDLPTAFDATYGSGELVIAICAEYDALPEIGHACGHNIIAAAAVGAGIALATVADELGITVRVIGTPAEETGGGKVLMLERGAFDGVGAAMMVHPRADRHHRCDLAGLGGHRRELSRSRGACVCCAGVRS